MRIAFITTLFLWTTLSAFGESPEFMLPSKTPIPSSYFGMHLIAPGIYQQNDYPKWPPTIGSLGKAGLVSWTYIEQSRGRYDWTKFSTLRLR